MCEPSLAIAHPLCHAVAAAPRAAARAQSLFARFDRPDHAGLDGGSSVDAMEMVQEAFDARSKRELEWGRVPPAGGLLGALVSSLLRALDDAGCGAPRRALARVSFGLPANDPRALLGRHGRSLTSEREPPDPDEARFVFRLYAAQRSQSRARKPTPFIPNERSLAYRHAMNNLRSTSGTLCQSPREPASTQGHCSRPATSLFFSPVLPPDEFLNHHIVVHRRFSHALRDLEYALQIPAVAAALLRAAPRAPRGPGTRPLGDLLEVGRRAKWMRMTWM